VLPIVSLRDIMVMDSLQPRRNATMCVTTAELRHLSPAQPTSTRTNKALAEFKAQQPKTFDRGPW
jgi:hypothetical protein